MKKKYRFQLFFVLYMVTMLISCKTPTYVSSNKLESKLPTLTPEIDWLSIETAYPDGYSLSATNSTSKTMYGNYSTIAGNYPGSATVGSSINTSQYIKNPQISFIRDQFTDETYNICDRSGKSKGTMVWSVKYHNYNENEFLEYFSGFIFPTVLFGMPYTKYTGVVSIKAEIFDSSKNFIASYSSEKKNIYWVAMWWGYSNKKAKYMAFYNPLIDAFNDIKMQIQKDYNTLNTKLLN